MTKVALALNAVINLAFFYVMFCKRTVGSTSSCLESLLGILGAQGLTGLALHYASDGLISAMLALGLILSSDRRRVWLKVTALIATFNLIWAGLLWATGGYVILAINVLALAVVLLSVRSDLRR